MCIRDRFALDYYQKVDPEFKKAFVYLQAINAMHEQGLYRADELNKAARAYARAKDLEISALQQLFEASMKLRYEAASAGLSKEEFLHLHTEAVSYTHLIRQLELQ